MGIPLCASTDAEPKRMVCRETWVIRTTFVQKGELTGCVGVPRVRRNQIERGLQLWLKPDWRLSSILYVLLDICDVNHRNTGSRFGSFFDSCLHGFSKFLWKGNDHQGQRACHQPIGPASPMIMQSIRGNHTTTNLSRKPAPLWGQPPPPLKGHSTIGIRRQWWRPTHHCNTEDIQSSKSVRTSFELTSFSISWRPPG